MSVEEILISAVPSDFAEEQQPVISVSTAVLRQADPLRFRTSTFELFDQRQLSIRHECAYKHARDYGMDIRVLDPEPTRSLRISRFYLSALMVAATATGLEWFTDIIPPSHLTAALISAGAATLAFLIMAAYRSHDHLVFRSRHGQVPLAVLLNNNPDRKTCKSFTDALTLHIQAAQDNFASSSDTLSQELKELRRLMENGAITGKRYESAKRRILGLHS